MPEKEYIERDAVIELAKSNKAVCSCLADIVDVMQIVNDISTADVQPVKHGKWKGYTKSAFYGCDEEGEPIYRDANFNVCSECGRKTVVKENFCPHCGAKMDGKE